MNIDNENFEIYRHEKDLSDLEYYCMECMRDFTVDEFEVDADIISHHNSNWNYNQKMCQVD